MVPGVDDVAGIERQVVMGKKVTAPELVKMKGRGEKIAMITSYDYCFAKLADEAGVDVILVGDSLGNVVFGDGNTLGVTMDNMARHTRSVSNAVQRALVLADMPFMSYQVSLEEALKNAGRLITEGGAAAVKLEGASEHDLTVISRLTEMGIPVVGHVGLTPQSVNVFGGFKTQGKDEASAKRIMSEAIKLQEAGCFAVVLEMVPAELAEEITKELTIPTVGIGAGPHCDGQVLVMHDMLGLYDGFRPSFVKLYADLAPAVRDAFGKYAKEVKGGEFPK